MTRLVLSVALLFTGCSSIDAATRQAGRSAAANWGHAGDEKNLTLRAREIGRANAVAWEVQFFCLTGSWRNDEARRRCLEAFGVKDEDALIHALEGAGD